ncbi:MAG: hypothetical protein LBS17_00885 [Actinomycetes bacterium]|nr:hypothetical protein [Actinomycetes bacterium]
MAEYPELSAPARVADLDAAGPFERKHTPHISTRPSDVVEGATDITITLGYYEPHPNEAGHFFDLIEVCAAGVPIARFAGIGGVVAPVVTATALLEPGCEITVLAHCNLHGAWLASAII